MSHTTTDSDDRHPAWSVARTVGAGTVAVVAAVAIGLGLAACGAGDQGSDPSAGGLQPTGTATPRTPVTGVPVAGGPTGGPGAPTDGTGTGGDGAGGEGDGAEGGSEAGEPSGRPPRILYTEAIPYAREGLPGVDVLGHAYDDDGPDPQLQVERVEVGWGDGTTTRAELNSGNVFRAHHQYDSSYLGSTVTVHIVAHSHGGRTASEEIQVDLPEG